MKNTLATIFTSLVTIVIYQWLDWWPFFVGGWIALGFVARKMSRAACHSKDNAWDYGFCNIAPPLAIVVMMPEYLDSEDGEQFKAGLPTFRSPIVWPTKPE